MAFGNGYSYRRSITVDNAKVIGSANHGDFPAVIKGTYSYLADTGNGGEVTDSNGYDIIFTSDEAGENQLDHEIERYINTSGEVVFWVRIPTLKYNEDTVIYMFYGNSSVTTSQEDVLGTWVGYSEVYHMKNLTTSTIKDSLGNYNGAKASAGNPVEANGQIGKAQDFSGDYIDLTNAPINNGNFAIECIVKADSLGGWKMFMSKDNSNYFGFYNNGLGQRCDYFDPGWGSGLTCVIDTWYYALWSCDVNVLEIVVLNNLSASKVPSGVADWASGTIKIGAYSDNGLNFDGIIEEFRVSEVFRSEDWGKTCHNNYLDSDNFYTVGERTPAKRLGAGITHLKAKNLVNIVGGGGIKTLIKLRKFTTPIKIKGAKTNL